MMTRRNLLGISGLLSGWPTSHIKVRVRGEIIKMARLSGLAFFYAIFVLLVVNLGVDPHPCWRCLFNHFVGGAIWTVRARQVSSAHQKFVDDFASCKLEGFLKQFHPFVFCFWVMMV